MNDAIEPRADWPQPFPPEEYAARRSAVARRLQEEGLDAMLVTGPADIHYLTGYDMIWFPMRSLIGCLVVAETADLVFLDYPKHETLVHTTPAIPAVVWLSSDDCTVAAPEVAAMLSARLARGARVAVQRWGYVPHTDIMDHLIATVTAAGFEVADRPFLIEELRLHKSPRELAHIRRAAAMADSAMTRAREALAPGVMETALEGVIMHDLMAAGGGYPAIRSMIASGVRAGTHHAPATHRRVGEDELVFVDFCAALHRYHVNLNRTFAVGEVDPRWHDLMARAAEGIDRVVETVRPGDPWSRVEAVGAESIERNGIARYVWFAGGYALGIALPPDWVGEHWVTPRYGRADRPLVPGMVFNLEAQFDCREGWAGGTGAAFIESFVVTEDGLEVLSTLPRTLERV